MDLVDIEVELDGSDDGESDDGSGGDGSSSEERGDSDEQMQDGGMLAEGQVRCAWEKGRGRALHEAAALQRDQDAGQPAWCVGTQLLKW